MSFLGALMGVLTVLALKGELDVESAPKFIAIVLTAALASVVIEALIALSRIYRRRTSKETR